MRKQRATLPETGDSNADQIRSGMAADQWQAAIRLQCAIRDAIDRPVSIVEALDLMTLQVRAGLFKPVTVRALQLAIDRIREENEAKRIENQRAIAERAGKP